VKALFWLACIGGVAYGAYWYAFKPACGSRGAIACPPAELEEGVGVTLRAAEICPKSGYLCFEGRRQIARWPLDKGRLKINVPLPEFASGAEAEELRAAAIEGIRAWDGHPFPLVIDTGKPIYPSWDVRVVWTQGLSIEGAAGVAHAQVEPVGKRIKFMTGEWEIVGVFESGGDRHESEIYGDADTVMSAIRRTGYQPVTVLLESPAAFETFKTALTTNPTLQVEAKRESDFYAEESKTLTTVLKVIAYVVGGIMAVGALFGALNTMYTAVSARGREIATLRALGFGATPVVISVFVEAVLLALIGGILGCLAAWFFFDGHVISTSGGGISQLVFALALTPGLIAVGVIWACVIGVVGGLFPAVRAARLPVATALRAV